MADYLVQVRVRIEAGSAEEAKARFNIWFGMSRSLVPHVEIGTEQIILPTKIEIVKGED